MAGLDLVETPSGTRLRLRVKAGARRNAITGLHAGALKISVTAVPERGRANHAVRELLGQALDVPPSSLAWVSGESSSDKVVLVPLSAAAVGSRLAATLGDT